MTLRFIPAAIAAAAVLTTALVACGGGGSTSPSAPPVSTNTQSQGSIPMTFAFHRHTSSGAARRPSYLSQDTQAIALFDGATLVYVANVETDGGPISTVYTANGSTTVAPGTCTLTTDDAVCTFTVTTTAGAHKFDVVAYPVNQSSSPVPTAARRGVRATTSFPFEGVILSEGELSVTLVAGPNPAKTLSLNGVADQIDYAGTTEIAYNASTTFGFRILDAANEQIVQPGGYDNGPITITASPTGVVTLTGTTSVSTPPASTGDQNFDVKCVNTAGGNVTISFNAGTQPNTTYAAGLTYSAANYATTPIGTISFTCDAAPATIPITVDGTTRHVRK